MTSSVPYKGLTIRFGADTTQFTTRMTALNKVIGGTQTKLNQLTKAMRGDPTSLTLLGERFTYLREQAANAFVKVDTLRRGIASMKAEIPSIDAMAKQVRDTALNYQRADAAVKNVNKALNDQYARLREIGAQYAIAFRKDNIDGFYEKIKKNNAAWSEYGATLRAARVEIDNLKKKHEVLEKARERASKIHEFKTMTTELKIAESEAQQFAMQVVEIREKLDTLTSNGKRLDALGAEFRELRAESSALENQYRALSSTVRKNKGDMDAYEKAVETAADRIRNAARQVEVLEEQLRLRQSQTGIEKVTESMTQLRLKVEAARESTVKAERELSEYKAKTDTARQSWESLKSTLKTVIQNTTELTDKQRAGLGITKEQEQEYRRLKSEIDAAAKKTRELEERADAAHEELKLAKAIEAQKKLQTELTESNAKLTALTTRAKGFGTAALNAARDFATGLGATVGPALMMTGMRVITAGDQIDTAFRDMKKTVDGTAEDFQHLREAAVEFSRTHPVSADTILEIEAMGGQLGIAVENLEEFARVVSNLDISTNMNADDIAIDLGKLANVLHLSTEEYESFGDSLVRLGNNFPALESDIMNITTRFAGMSAIVGVMPDEVLAIATAATATGQRADAAGGSLQRTFGRIEGAVAGLTDALMNNKDAEEEDAEAYEQAVGKLQAYADIAGVSAEEFQALWENNEKLSTGVTGTTTAFQKFIEGLKRIGDEGGSVDATLVKLGITGVRDRQLLEGLTNTTDVLSAALVQSNDAWGDVANGIASGGDAAKEAANRAEGFSGKLKMIKNTAQTMGDAFASKLVPLMDKLLELLQGAAKWIDNMDEGLATSIAVFGAFTVALAPVMRMVSQTAITFGAFSVAARDAGIATKGVGIALPGTSQKMHDAKMKAGLLSAAFESLENPAMAAKVAVGLLVVGLVALGKAIYDYNQEQVKYRKATTDMKNAIYDTGEAMRESSEAFYAGGETYKRCLEDVKALAEEHAKLYDKIVETNKETAASEKTMERYIDIVAKNNGVYADNRAEAERLKYAVEKLNGEYGMGLKLVEEDGALHVYAADGAYLETQKINELVEAKKREIEMNALASMQEDLVAQQIKDEQQLADAKKAVAIAQEQLNDALAAGDEYAEEYRLEYERALADERKAQELYDGTTAALKNLEGQFTRTAQATDEHGEKVKELASKYPVLRDELDQVSDHAFGDFVKALEDAGFSTEALETLTASEIGLMTDSWKAGTDTWKNDMAVATDRMANDVGMLDEKTRSTFEKMRQSTIKEISEMTGISEEELAQFVDEAGIDSAEAMLNWVNNIKNSKKKSGDAAELNADAVRNELQKAVEDAKTTGWNIGAGLARGIENSTYLAGIAGAALANAAIDAANAAADTGSPSKKTMWLGEMVGKGYVVGMEGEEDAVRKQGALLSELAIGAGASKRSASLGALNAAASRTLGGTTNNTTNNSTANEYVNITLNVEARDLQDMNTIDDFLTMVKRSRAQYA